MHAILLQTILGVGIQQSWNNTNAENEEQKCENIPTKLKGQIQWGVVGVQSDPKADYTFGGTGPQHNPMQPVLPPSNSFLVHISNNYNDNNLLVLILV